MLTFRKCPRPDNRALAKFRPEGDLHGHKSEIENHLTFWQERGTRHDSPNDIPLNKLASVMIESLQPTVIALDHAARIKPVYPAKYEAFRREGLSRLALSLLMRHILGSDDPAGDETELGDGQVFGFGNLLPEPAYDNDNSMPIDLRVHLLPDVADEALRPYRGKEPAKVWYRSNDLYVRRVMPAEPSEAFAVDVATDVAAQGIEVDFSQLQTLYPYLASRV